jgi:GH15 family glucan-1,4-alpha-glucosidase
MELFERLLALRNDLGLLSEEYDVKQKRLVGNFPQALSHIALVGAAFALEGRTSLQQEQSATTANASGS